MVYINKKHHSISNISDVMECDSNKTLKDYRIADVGEAKFSKGYLPDGNNMID